jgi:hypothetical protein
MLLPQLGFKAPGSARDDKRFVMRLFSFDSAARFGTVLIAGVLLAGLRQLWLV